MRYSSSNAFMGEDGIRWKAVYGERLVGFFHTRNDHPVYGVIF
jgi:hypothetical protein